jgi:hypothetical protein
MSKPYGFPKIVTLCGSTYFKSTFENVSRELTLQGVIVLSVGMFGHHEVLDMDGPVKKMLDELHFRKIDLSDEILVLNGMATVCSQCQKRCEEERDSCASISHCCKAPTNYVPYIGQSTSNEIAYARAQGKNITYLTPIGEQ